MGTMVTTKFIVGLSTIGLSATVISLILGKTGKVDLANLIELIALAGIGSAAITVISELIKKVLSMPGGV